VDNPAEYGVPDLVTQSGEQVYRCSYCGFIWTEKAVPGGMNVRKRSIGFFDNIQKPNEFFAAPFHKLKK